MNQRLSTEQVARRLGVKPETIYAYVSRGVLKSTRDASGSWFDEAAVEAFATRTRRKRPAIGTSLMSIDDGQLSYRGRDVAELIHEPFESVANWLWLGKWEAGLRFTSPAAVQVPDGVPYLDQLRIALALAAPGDPSRYDLRPSAVAHTAARIIATMVDALSPRSDVAGSPARLAERLWGKLSGRVATPGDIKALNAALVLMADHGMATSTVAARVAASVQANPYAVVAAGLSAFEGPLHGAGAAHTYRLIADAIASGDPIGTYAEWLRTSGHAFAAQPSETYPAGDVRAVALLGLIEDLPEVVKSLIRAELTGYPTTEFALAALAHSGLMRPGAAEVIFVIGRTAGWLAHAMEEYQEPGLRFRLQTRYARPSAR